MSVRRFHQVVFCSERDERAYRREISVAVNNAMVTAIEALPPHYHVPLERLRDPHEEVFEYEGRVDYFAGYAGCPFCGNRNVFYCNCGVISCRDSSKGRPQHCPGCKKIHNAFSTEKNPMSKSGFVHGGQRIEGRIEARPVEGGQLWNEYNPERRRESEKLQGYFERKALEDKRKKDG